MKPAVRWMRIGLLLVLAVALTADGQRADEPSRVPREVEVLPGEPIRVLVSARSNSAANIRFHIPPHASLKLRALEKLPVQRSAEGGVVYRRMIVWQALEPGVFKINGLSVETKGRKLPFPVVVVNVRDPGS